MKKANSRLTAITWGQIRDTSRASGVKGLPSDGDRIQCFRKGIPVGGRQICFMMLTRGPVQGIVVILAAVAPSIRNQNLKPIQFTKREAPKLFIEAMATAEKLRRREEQERGGARRDAGESPVRKDPSPFGTHALSAKPKPHTRAGRRRIVRAARQMRQAG